LPGRGSAPGAIFAISITFTVVFIDFTAIDVVVYLDKEGVVLPQG
jgi:hypothetical protein